MRFRGISAGIVLMLLAFGGCDDEAPAAGFSWNQDGVATHASGWIGQLSRSSLGLIALTRSEFSLAILLWSSGGPPSPGTFVCSSSTNGSVILSLSRRGDLSLSFRTQSCSVSLTNVGQVGGANATGTFQATVVRSDGKVTSITDGIFNVPVRD